MNNIINMKRNGNERIEITGDDPSSFEINGDNVDYIMMGPKPRGRCLIGFEEVE